MRPGADGVAEQLLVFLQDVQREYVTAVETDAQKDVVLAYVIVRLPAVLPYRSDGQPVMRLEELVVPAAK